MGDQVIWRYKIQCTEFSTSVEEHGEVIGKHAEEGWELVTIYETDTEWRFVFRRPDEHRMS